MKRISPYLLGLLALLFAACETNESDLQLDGDCLVEALSLDQYAGTIDPQTQTITVRIPETYDERAMAVTGLRLSDGATCNVKAGDRLNMQLPKTLHVVNGNVFIDWTLKALHDEARILSFRINGTYNGIINEEQKTISVFVPATLNLASLIPTVKLSDNATVTPLSGVACDFTKPVQFTVSNNTATATYTVTVTAIDKPSALYVGLAPSMDQLNIEEQTACEWMIANIANSLYASFDDIASNTVDLSECKVIWWHFHRDGGVDGKAAFEGAAPEAVNAQVALTAYYNNGGSFFLTRYATNLPAFINAVKNDACPNNCWGGAETTPEIVGGPWDFIIEGSNSHPLFQNIVFNGDNNRLPCFDAGYGATNSTAQWHIGTDWGEYPSHENWREQTGGIDLAWGGDGAIVAWEFPAADGKGHILCIGSGCYDWYSSEPRPDDKFHVNIATMTQNAFDYLMK